MTDQERITFLEMRIAQLEARLAAIENRQATPTVDRGAPTHFRFLTSQIPAPMIDADAVNRFKLNKV